MKLKQLIVLAFASTSFSALALTPLKPLTLPEGLTCKKIACMAAECDVETFTVKGMNGSPSGTVNGDEVSGSVSIDKIVSKEDEYGFVDLEKYAVWAVEDGGHDFVVVDFYARALTELTEGKVKTIVGKYSKGFIWGDSAVGSVGILECRALK